MNGWKRSPTSNTTAIKETIMDKEITAFLAVIFTSMFSFATISDAQNMDANQALNAKQEKIVTIAAF